jgi:tripeptide aminopeptidase
MTQVPPHLPAPSPEPRERGSERGARRTGTPLSPLSASPPPTSVGVRLPTFVGVRLRRDGPTGYPAGRGPGVRGNAGHRIRQQYQQTIDIDAVVEDTLRLARIPAPTFSEQARGAAVAAALADAGVRAEFDGAGNVFGRISGQTSTRTVAVIAHLDTVFPLDTPLDIARTGDRLTGPGVGDNALALAAMLWLARSLKLHPPAGDVLLAATVCEEGLGDLRGARALAANHPEIAAGIVLEGHFLGRIIHAGVGSRRFEITFAGPGGHSWQNFGAPNAVHTMLQVGSTLVSLPLPSSPKTTLTVGVAEGGTSVNSIADRSHMLVDTRSLSEDRLGALESDVRTVIHDLGKESGIDIAIERIGQRPSVELPPDHPLVECATVALRSMGIEPQLGAASTDMNALQAAGIPSICIGISTGDHMHRLDEWVSVEPIQSGLEQLAFLVKALGRMENGS